MKIVFKTGTWCGLLAGGFFVAASACSHNSERPPETASAAPLSSAATLSEAANSATDSIAEARCAREDRCSNVGDGKKYSSLQDCLARVRADWKDDLSTRECPRGVNQKELGQCVSEIRNEECSNPLDSLSRMTQCTSGQICN